MRVTALIAGGTFAAGLAAGWVVNGWRLEARIASLEASYAKAYAEAQLAARNKEQALVKQFEEIRKSKDAQIKNISNRLASALNGLQNRPGRPDPMPDNSQHGNAGSAGCSPAELYREDAEFLVQFSATTEEMKEGLKYCIAQYNAAREIINK